MGGAVAAGFRGRSSGPDRQRRRRAAPARRLWRNRRRDVPSTRAWTAAGRSVVSNRSRSSGTSTIWRETDEGIWEVRGPRQHFTHSKVMAWVAFDRAARVIDEYGGPDDQSEGAKWSAIR